MLEGFTAQVYHVRKLVNMMLMDTFYLAIDNSDWKERESKRRQVLDVIQKHEPLKISSKVVGLCSRVDGLDSDDWFGLIGENHYFIKCEGDVVQAEKVIYTFIYYSVI